MRRTAIIKTRIEQQTKDAARKAAGRMGLNESAWLRRLIGQALKGSAETTSPSPAPAPEARRPAQVTIRLGAADQRLLEERAQARGIPRATYAAVFITAHLRAFPPLVAKELDAMKSAVVELNAIGRNLNQIARVAHQSGSVPASLSAELHALLRACERLRDHVTELMDANLASWEAGDDQASH